VSPRLAREHWRGDSAKPGQPKVDASPADVAQAVAFYASEDNAFMTGITAAVNGGLSMY
jgi:NAD(P)-dependent dehydrogenase (short-subunit alcohol dehydrogenase family)